MSRFPRLVLVAVAAAVLCAGFAAAATLGVSSAALAAGTAPVASCSTGGFAFSRTVDNLGAVTGVTVGDIGAGCAGATLALTIAGNPSGGQYASLAELSATVPSPCTGGCSLTFTGFASIDASAIGAYSAAVISP